jgi:hypothetical protein
MSKQQTEKDFKNLLKGKTIIDVRYLTDEEMADTGWYKNPLVLIFSDGSYMMAQSDDEGNNGGAYYYADDKVDKTIFTY